MKKIILYILRGIGLGCVFFTLSGIIFDIIFKGSFLLNHWYYTKMAIGSMITGIAFYVPSLVYQNEKLSKGLQVYLFLFGLDFICIIDKRQNVSMQNSKKNKGLNL